MVKANRDLPTKTFIDKEIELDCFIDKYATNIDNNCLIDKSMVNDVWAIYIYDITLAISHRLEENQQKIANEHTGKEIITNSSKATSS